MSTKFDVTHSLDGTRGRYVIRLGQHEADLTYSVASAQLIIADHTGVPEALRGTGAGLALVERMVADAYEKGFKIMPLCPFVNAQRRKHPDWADVFST